MWEAMEKSGFAQGDICCAVEPATEVFAAPIDERSQHVRIAIVDSLWRS
jgi:hypothetical protein